MGRKKILGGHSQATEAFEIRPFCYYCDREFDTTKTLIQHQRSKHLACAECGLKFDTVTGLRVHMLNAYKKTMKEVPGAIPGRDNPDIVVHGMEGVPKSVIEEKTKVALAERAEKEKIEKARLEKERAERPAPPPEPHSASGVASGEEPRKAPSPPTDDRPKKKMKSESAPLAAAEDRPTSLPPAPEPPAPPAPQISAVPPPSSLRAQHPPPVQQQPAASTLGLMAGLSPAVQKLLAGDNSKDTLDPKIAVTVPGLPGRTVPGALAGLHTVALQVLAVAGVLPSGKSSGGGNTVPRTFAEKRPVPVNETLLAPSVFQPLAFTASSFGQLPGAFPPGALTGAMGAAGTHVAVGVDTKRPRLENHGFFL